MTQMPEQSRQSLNHKMSSKESNEPINNHLCNTADLGTVFYKQQNYIRIWCLLGLKWQLDYKQRPYHYPCPLNHSV